MENDSIRKSTRVTEYKLTQKITSMVIDKQKYIPLYSIARYIKICKAEAYTLSSCSRLNVILGCHVAKGEMESLIGLQSRLVQSVKPCPPPKKELYKLVQLC